jgi:hypothetical protein
MTVTIDIVDQDVFTALRTFLLTFLPTGTEVVQGIDNQVPMPVGGWVSMTSAGMQRLSTNVNTFLDQTESFLTPSRYDIQLDFYGPNSQAWATMCQTLLRDEYATSQFPANIQPLFADDPLQIPLVNAESQYEQRWKLTASLQYNPTITATQQSAISLDIGLKPIDQTFKP